MEYKEKKYNNQEELYEIIAEKTKRDKDLVKFVIKDFEKNLKYLLLNPEKFDLLNLNITHSFTFKLMIGLMKNRVNRNWNAERIKNKFRILINKYEHKKNERLRKRRRL